MRKIICVLLIGGMIASCGKSGSEGNKPPAANFGVSGTGLKVQFVDKSSDADGAVITRNWDFGNGKTAKGREPSTEYSAEGTYTVKLTVTDNQEAVNTISQVLTVAKDKKPIINKLPKADFEFTGKGLTLKFADKSKDSDGKIVKWAWDFGNGSDNKTANPSVNYRSSGTFDVKLVVTDDKGGTGEVTKKIKVSKDAQPILVK